METIKLTREQVESFDLEGDERERFLQAESVDLILDGASHWFHVISSEKDRLGETHWCVDIKGGSQT